MIKKDWLFLKIPGWVEKSLWLVAYIFFGSLFLQAFDRAKESQIKALQDMVEVLEQRLELELEEKKSSRDD